MRSAVLLVVLAAHVACHGTEWGPPRRPTPTLRSAPLTSPTSAQIGAGNVALARGDYLEIDRAVLRIGIARVTRVEGETASLEAMEQEEPFRAGDVATPVNDLGSGTLLLAPVGRLLRIDDRVRLAAGAGLTGRWQLAGSRWAYGVTADGFLIDGGTWSTVTAEGGAVLRPRPWLELSMLAGVGIDTARFDDERSGTWSALGSHAQLTVAALLRARDWFFDLELVVVGSLTFTDYVLHQGELPAMGPPDELDPSGFGLRLGVGWLL
jgi:hypothetical protein